MAWAGAAPGACELCECERCPCSGEILIHTLHPKDKILQSMNTALDLCSSQGVSSSSGRAHEEGWQP